MNDEHHSGKMNFWSATLLLFLANPNGQRTEDLLEGCLPFTSRETSRVQGETHPG